MAAAHMDSVEPADENPEESPGVTDDAEPLDDDVTATLYLRSSSSPPVKRRQGTARDRFEALREEVLAAAEIRGWNRRVDATELAEVPAADLYDELAAAVGSRGHLDPFFSDRSTGFGDRTVVFPALCLTLRRGDEVTGLYPCWHEGEHWAVEDGLRALETGADAENLA